jgi:hypothetical protein
MALPKKPLKNSLRTLFVPQAREEFNSKTLLLLFKEMPLQAITVNLKCPERLNL